MDHAIFNGKKYYLEKSGKYYRYGKKRLHVDIYEYHYGEVPKGFHVHHIDFNPLNNSLENLVALSAGDHRKIHNAAKRRELTCGHCAKVFMAVRKTRKYCSDTCQQSARYHRRDDHKEFPCAICGKNFVKNRYSKSSTCSRPCAIHKWRQVNGWGG